MGDVCPTSGLRSTGTTDGRAETVAIRDAAAAWLRERLGRSSRIIFELALGDRRIDVVGVGERDIVGIEIKGPRDTLSRLPEQLDEFRRWLPEVWVAIHPRWVGRTDRHDRGNRMIVGDGKITAVRKPPYWRDECVCSQLLRLLWRVECARIAQRMDVIPGRTLSAAPTHKIRPMLARLLTGNEIVREVCRELRARPLVGIDSDGATR